WLSELPALSEPRWRGQGGQVPRRAAGLPPTSERFLLNHREPGSIQEDTSPGARLPGGHPAAVGHFSDKLCPLGGVSICQEGKRPDGPRPVTPRAVVPKDRRHMLRECDRLFLLHRFPMRNDWTAEWLCDGSSRQLIAQDRLERVFQVADLSS